MGRKFKQKIEELLESPPDITKYILDTEVSYFPTKHIPRAIRDQMDSVLKDLLCIESIKKLDDQIKKDYACKYKLSNLPYTWHQLIKAVRQNNTQEISKYKKNILKSGKTW